MSSNILNPDVHPLTVFTAVFGTESNTFLGKQITQASFESAFLFRPGEHPHELTEVSAPLHILRQAQIQHGWIVKEGTYAFALPGGRVKRTTYENLRDEILGQISNERSLDFNEKSNQRVHASYEDFREILKVELDRELTPKQRAEIYKLLMESADKQSAKDTENKRFLEGLFSKAAIVGAVLAVGLLAVFGGLTNIESEDESKN